MSNELTKQSGFALQPQNLQEAMELARMLASSSMVPKNYANKPDDTLVAMMMGAELRLNPIQSLQNIAVINGRPSIYGDALLALMQNHPAFGGITEAFDEATMTASCTVWRKGGEQHTQVFSQADAQTAGLWGKQGPWKQYPKRMLQWRARGFAIRNQFADALAGLITQDEAEDLPTGEPRDVTPEHVQIEDYPSKLFEQNFESWRVFIRSGKKTAKDLISMVQTKGLLTEDQKQRILDCEIIEGDKS